MTTRRYIKFSYFRITSLDIHSELTRVMLQAEYPLKSFLLIFRLIEVVKSAYQSSFINLVLLLIYSTNLFGCSLLEI